MKLNSVTMATIPSLVGKYPVRVVADEGSGLHAQLRRPSMPTTGGLTSIAPAICRVLIKDSAG